VRHCSPRSRLGPTGTHSTPPAPSPAGRPTCHTPAPFRQISSQHTWSQCNPLNIITAQLNHCIAPAWLNGLRKCRHSDSPNSSIWLNNTAACGSAILLPRLRTIRQALTSFKTRANKLAVALNWHKHTQYGHYMSHSHMHGFGWQHGVTVVVYFMAASQLANVYSWHKYHLHIPIATSEKADDYRHAVLTLQVQEGRPPMATHGPVNITTGYCICACCKLTIHAILSVTVTVVNQCQHRTPQVL
jgi:hypothetical protein